MKDNNKDLVKLTDEVLCEYESYSRENATSPYKIHLGDKTLWIYLKNLSSAHFKNKDVTRAQLPKNSEFSKIKKSDIDIIFLGYDCENDVYATWNPYIIKQRLNEAKYVSLYSRMVAQKYAKESNGFVSKKLNNDLEVCVFPRHMLGEYLMNYEQYFENNSQYVARGSKRRKDANMAYKLLKDTNNIKPFAQYLDKHNCPDTSEYCWAVKLLMNRKLFIRYCNDFLLYDKVEDYYKAIETFASHEEISQIFNHANKDVADILHSYVDFLVRYSSKNTSEREENKSEYNTSTHKITHISDEEVLKHIEPFLNKDIPTPLPAIQYLMNYYSSIYPDINMELKDWSNLIHSIKWEK